MYKGVTVAGMGCLCACGNSTDEVFQGAKNGYSNFNFPIGRVKSTYVSSYPVFMVAPNILAKLDSGYTISTAFFIKVATEAILTSGIPLDKLVQKRVGVIIGASVDSSFHCFESYEHWKKNILNKNDLADLKKYIAQPISRTVCKHFGFSGPFQTIVTACASGTDAIGLAKSWIETDICDVVLCGGTDEISISPYNGFARLLVASKEKCKPFDKNRNGINIGEGAAALLLVSDSILKEFNVAPKGYVLGYGNCCDGFHPTAPDPTAKGLKKAMFFALKDAQVVADSLAFVNAHATASQANDAAESIAFKEICPKTPIWASKGVTGHTLGAAGAVEAVLTIQALNNRLLPKSFGFSDKDSSLGIEPTLSTICIEKNCAMSDSLAFGGCNAALVLGAFDYAE